MFSAKRHSKLLPRGDGPFQVLEHINDNTYKLDLPSEYSVSATFNISDLSPFDVGDDLRTNPSQEEGNDEGTTNKWSVDPIQVPIRLVTRVRAKRFKETINVLIQHIWVEESSWRSKGGAKSVLQDCVSVVQEVE